MINACLIGDSVLWGAMGEGRLNPHPQHVLNASQSRFLFSENYSRSGASFAGVLSSDWTVREANGLPNGATLGQTLANSGCQGVLFSLGGNDLSGTTYEKALLVNNIKDVASIAEACGMLFCFVGIVDASVKSAIQNIGANPYDSFAYVQEACRLATNAEILKQTCSLSGYPYVDTRSQVDYPFHLMTGDIAHPSQGYSEAIFRKVAEAISA